jgi:hypothetical protein
MLVVVFDKNESKTPQHLQLREIIYSFGFSVWESDGVHFSEKDAAHAAVILITGNGFPSRFLRKTPQESERRLKDMDQRGIVAPKWALPAKELIAVLPTHRCLPYAGTALKRYTEALANVLGHSLSEEKKKKRSGGHHTRTKSVYHLGRHGESLSL